MKETVIGLFIGASIITCIFLFTGATKSQDVRIYQMAGDEEGGYSMIDTRTGEKYDWYNRGPRRGWISKGGIYKGLENVK